MESDSDLSNWEELLRVLDWVPKLWYHLHTFLEKHSTSRTSSSVRPRPGGSWWSPSPPRLQRVEGSLAPRLQP